MPERPPRRCRPEWTGWARRLAVELRHVWDFLDGEPVHLTAATLGGNLAPRLESEPWSTETLTDLVYKARKGRPLLARPQRPQSYLKSLIQALPAHYRRADRVAAEHHVEVCRQAAELAAAQAQRDQARAAQSAAVVPVTTGRRIRNRIALYVGRPTAVNSGVCVGGCGTSASVLPRQTPEHPTRTVPLCDHCWQHLDVASDPLNQVNANDSQGFDRLYGPRHETYRDSL